MLARDLSLALLLLSTASTGCQAAMVPAVAPTIDTQGNLGVEGRVDLVGSIGSRTTMVAIGVGGPGGGYHEQLGGYFSHSIDVGARYGDTQARPIVRGRTSGVFVPRVSRYGSHDGVGAMTEVMVGVSHGRKPFQTVLIGPRLQGEAVIAVTKETPSIPGAVNQVRGMFSLAFTVEMIFFAGGDAATVPPPEEPALPPPPRGPSKPPLVVPE